MPKPPSHSNPRRKAYFKPAAQEERPSKRFSEDDKPSHKPFDRPKSHGSSERAFSKAPSAFKPRGRFDEDSRPPRRSNDQFGERSSRSFDTSKPHGAFKTRGRFNEDSRSPRSFDKSKTSIKSKLHFEENAPKAPRPYAPQRSEKSLRTEYPKSAERYDNFEGTFHDPHPKTRSPAAFKTSAPSKPIEPSNVGEVKIYGQHACLALFHKRPQDIIRLYCLESTIPRISELLKHCVDNKKAYHVVTAEEMQRITDSVHHEGLCILTKERISPSFEELLAALKSQKGPQTLIYLEGVENPHNIGSLLRICAHFGVKYLLTDANEISTLPPATYRVAKGGVEEVTFVPLKNSLKMLQQLKDQGFNLVASSGYAKNSLYSTSLPEKTIFIFGSETNGIADSFLKLCNDILVVPGSGGVESLNVSITSALFLGEFWRQHRQSQ